MKQLDVIIPVFNESRQLPDLFNHLHTLGVIATFIDGGSTDDSLSLIGASEHNLLWSIKGRGRQLQAGVEATSGDVVLFLHADCRLPLHFRALVAKALRGHIGGAFRVRHCGTGGTRLLLPLADLHSRLSTTPYGDQAIFVRRSALLQIGGVPEQPLFEDVELSRRLKKVGSLATITEPVLISARRYEAASLRTVAAMRLFPLLYDLGVPAQKLSKWYGDVGHEG